MACDTCSKGAMTSRSRRGFRRYERGRKGRTGDGAARHPFKANAGSQVEHAPTACSGENGMRSGQLARVAHGGDIQRKIQQGLRTVALSAIATVLGVSKPYASDIRVLGACRTEALAGIGKTHRSVK